MPPARASRNETRSQSEGKANGVAAAQLAMPSHRGVASHSTLLVILILAVAASVLSYRAFLSRYDRVLRNAVQKEFTELFPDARVFVGRVHAEGDGVVTINDLRFANVENGTKETVLTAERVVLEGNLEVADWLKGKIRVRQLKLYGAQLEAWQLASGEWSIQCLKARSKPGAVPPTITFGGAIVRLRRGAEKDAPVVAFHDVAGQIEPKRAEQVPQSLETCLEREIVRNKAIDRLSHPASLREALLAANPGAPNAPNPTEDAPTSSSISNSVETCTIGGFQVQLSARSSGLLRSGTMTASYDPSCGALTAGGKLEHLSLSPELLKQLPPDLSKYLSQLSGLECQTSSSFELIAAPGKAAVFRIQGSVLSGRLQDPRLPYPLEDLRGDFFCRNSLLQLRSMQARSGGASLTLNTDIHGFGLDSPMVIQVDAQNLDLDDRLYQSLPQAWRDQWDRLELDGRVSGKIQLSFDGTRWSPNAEIACQNVSTRPWLFPYPLTNIRGLVHYKDGVISSERMEGIAGGQPIIGSFRLYKAQNSEWLGKLESKTVGAIAIDERLITAMTPRDKPTSASESFIRTLHPSGSIELLYAKLERSSVDSPNWYREVDANIYGGTLQYEQFTYPIYDIRGRITNRGDRWTLDQFEGRNDSCRIFCNGNWEAVRSGLLPFELQIQAVDVPIEEELLKAIPSEAQVVWEELQPSGSIDQVTASVIRKSDSNQIYTRVEFTEESSSNAVTGRSLRLHPQSFPYWLTDVDCKVLYEPGKVTIDRLSASNGSTRLAMEGDCQPTEDGYWTAEVNWLPSTRLLVDSQLLKALPKSIRDSLVSLDYRGPISLLGRSRIRLPKSQNELPATSWDCQLDIEDGKLAEGSNISSIRGTAWVRGGSDGTNMNLSGRLLIDAVAVRGIPVTNLQGPFLLMGTKLYFGSNVFDVLPPVDATTSDSMTADALGGQLTLAGHAKLDTGKFYVDAELSDAELSALLQDVGVAQAAPQARCNAKLEFNGVPWNVQTYDGSGVVQLRDAKLYELPFMMRLLSVASVNAGNDSAFQTADINFELDGDRIPLRVACDGEVLRLRGEGWTNLRREIDLQLYSYVGRRLPISAVVSPLLEESRYATFMMIEVSGSLDNPQMQRRPFPQLEATIGQIFPEVAERRPLDKLRPWNN